MTDYKITAPKRTNLKCGEVLSAFTWKESADLFLVNTDVLPSIRDRIAQNQPKAAAPAAIKY